MNTTAMLLNNVQNPVLQVKPLSLARHILCVMCATNTNPICDKHWNVALGSYNYLANRCPQDPGDSSQLTLSVAVQLTQLVAVLSADVTIPYLFPAE